MDLFRFLLLLAASLRAVYAAEEDPADAANDPSSTPNLAVKINTTFPSAEVFGIKLVNGQRNEAVLSLKNEEPIPITLQLIGGSLWSPDFGEKSPSQLVRNLTAVPYRETVPAGESETFSYGIQMEMHPVDLVLKLGAVVTDDKSNFYSLAAFEGNVSIVEKPTSWLDPQVIFLYLILLGGFAGTAYFVYNTWFSTLFPQQKRGRGGKGGERAKTSSKGSKAVDPAEQVSVAAADGPAVTSSSKVYDESWIPQHHIQRPEAKRIRSGTPSGVKTKKVT